MLVLNICKTIENVNNIADNNLQLVYSERKVVKFYLKSNAILKLHISSMLPVTSAIQSDILHLNLRAVDVYINVSPLTYT